jgi:hypothetical protein
VLIKGGINAPEQLLSMALVHIQLIQGIGPVLITEIERYRAQFQQAHDKKPAAEDDPRAGASD